MAGEWIKVEISTPNKPEVMRMARLLKIDRDAVFGKLLRLWAWFDTNSVDGVVDGVVSTDVDEVCYQVGFCDALKAVGWIVVDQSNERISLPNFDRHNGESAKKRALKNESQAKWRKSRSVVDSSESTKEPQNDLPEKRREEKSNSVPKGTDGKPSPSEIIFSYGIPLLVNAGSTDKQARSFFGGLRKHHGDEAVVDALRECIRAKPLQPLDWLAAALPPKGKSKPPESFKERDSRKARERWEEMTGETHPDSNVLNVVEIPVKRIEVING
jgi:hypothetical protein